MFRSIGRHRRRHTLASGAVMQAVALLVFLPAVIVMGGGHK